MGVLRVRLARGQAARHLQHNEFVRVVRDAAARAGLPIARTNGHVIVESGPPLTQGSVSVCEYFDFELVAPITGLEFGRRLAEELPEGIDVLSLRRIPARTPNLKASAAMFCYSIAGEFDHGKVDAFERAASWPVRRVRKGRERILDLKKSLLKLRVTPSGLEIHMRVLKEGTPKPEEVVEAVFGISREEALLLPTERSGIGFHTDAALRQPDTE